MPHRYRSSLVGLCLQCSGYSHSDLAVERVLSASCRPASAWGSWRLQADL